MEEQTHGYIPFLHRAISPPQLKWNPLGGYHIDPHHLRGFYNWVAVGQTWGGYIKKYGAQKEKLGWDHEWHRNEQELKSPN